MSSYQLIGVSTAKEYEAFLKTYLSWGTLGNKGLVMRMDPRYMSMLDEHGHIAGWAIYGDLKQAGGHELHLYGFGGVGGHTTVNERDVALLQLIIDWAWYHARVNAIYLSVSPNAEHIIRMLTAMGGTYTTQYNHDLYFTLTKRN